MSRTSPPAGGEHEIQHRKRWRWPPTIGSPSTLRPSSRLAASQARVLSTFAFSPLVARRVLRRNTTASSGLRTIATGRTTRARCRHDPDRIRANDMPPLSRHLAQHRGRRAGAPLLVLNDFPNRAGHTHGRNLHAARSQSKGEMPVHITQIWAHTAPTRECPITALTCGCVVGATDGW